MENGLFTTQIFVKIQLFTSLNMEKGLFISSIYIMEKGVFTAVQLVNSWISMKKNIYILNCCK